MFVDGINVFNCLLPGVLKASLEGPFLLQDECLCEQVCITGISCRLPKANNMAEFRQNLQNGADMLTTEDPDPDEGQYST